MINKFKKSSIGQIVTAAFFIACVVAGIMFWFYESIRIPTLTSQLAFQKNKVKNLEDDLIKEKDKTKELITAIENKTIESEKYRTSAKQTSYELSQVGEKLRKSQKEQVRIAKELSVAKMDLLKLGPQKSLVSNSLNKITINFEEAVLSSADKEDATFLTIDNYLSDLRLISLSMFNQEMDAARSKAMTATKSLDLDTVAKSFNVIIEKLGTYHGLLISLERLNVFATKRIIDHYRQKLKKFEHNSSDAFLSDIRKHPPILSDLGELIKKLKTIENVENWNTNATKAINEFISNNNDLSNKKTQNMETNDTLTLK